MEDEKEVEEAVEAESEVTNIDLAQAIDTEVAADSMSETTKAENNTPNAGSDSMLTETSCEPKYKQTKIARIEVEHHQVPVVTQVTDITTDVSQTVDIVDAPCATTSSDAQEPKITEEQLSKDLAETSLDHVEKDAEMVPVEGEEEEKKEDIEAIESANVGPCYWDYKFSREEVPFCFAASSEMEYTCEFLKGCKWAPDGSCLLTNSDDSVLRLFNFSENVSQVQDWANVTKDDVGLDAGWSSALKIREGGLIYDYSWYPFASSMDPSTTVFLATSKDAPIHLWDATYGNLRATYLAYNDADEPIASYSVSFDASGENIYAGYDKSIRIFNISRPGRQCIHRKLNTSHFPELRQNGLISCFAFNPAWSNVYACGSYRKTIGIYMEDGSPIYMLNKHVGGVTNLVFSRDGTKLYSGARSDSRLICWDLRNLGTEYKIYTREVKSQQRIYFELTTNDRYLISGGTDGIVRIWDTTEENSEPYYICASPDCVNGVSLNPYVPVLATATGQRRLYEVADDSDDESFFTSKPRHSCGVKLWKV